MKFFFSFLGFGFGRERFWVWKRSRLQVQEKEGRRKYGFWVWKRRVMDGLEEKGFGFGGENVCRNSKRKEEGRKENLVLTPFIWFIKLDRCQNFK